MKLALQVLLDCVAVSLVVALSFALIAGGPLTPELVTLLLKIWLYIWIYTILIATPAHWILPRIYPLLARKRPAVRWAVLVVALATISVGGSLIGSLVLFGLGLEPGMTFAQLVSLSVTLSVSLAVLVGIVHAMVLLLRYRLQATEKELLAREIDYERARKTAAEARLAELESRIHPHFLFNTLNTVSSLIPTSPERAERLIERLSALLRFSLDAHEEGLVTLEQELKIVRDYLDIEQARFGERVRFTIEADDAVAKIPVPPFSVQTLVENTIKFAVAPTRRQVEIRIHAGLEDGGVRITVADTGPGFAELNVPAGHGIDNLRSRLTLLFGDRDSLRISRLDGWTAVGFRVPA